MDVSIPIGFSSSLQLEKVFGGRPSYSKVSIPIGFSSSLQLRRMLTDNGHPIGFNPYRVFKFVATRRTLRLRWPCQRSFNPYRVFKFVATIIVSSDPCPVSVLFQSLSGFQVRCNSLRRPPGPCHLVGFNPYRVFKFVATQGT